MNRQELLVLLTFSGIVMFLALMLWAGILMGQRACY